jgi:hypothetical protein
MQVCHVQDIEHQIYKCLFGCERLCAKNGHSCPDKCYVDPCPPCDVLAETTLPCTHTVKLFCHIDTKSYNCVKWVVRGLACGHDASMFCYKDPTKVDCSTQVTKTLPCGHEQVACCHEPVEVINCLTDVSVTIPDCKHEVLNMALISSYNY